MDITNYKGVIVQYACLNCCIANTFEENFEGKNFQIEKLGSCDNFDLKFRLKLSSKKLSCYIDIYCKNCKKNVQKELIVKDNDIDASYEYECDCGQKKLTYGLLLQKDDDVQPKNNEEDDTFSLLENKNDDIKKEDDLKENEDLKKSERIDFENKNPAEYFSNLDFFPQNLKSKESKENIKNINSSKNILNKNISEDEKSKGNNIPKMLDNGSNTSYDMNKKTNCGINNINNNSFFSSDNNNSLDNIQNNFIFENENNKIINNLYEKNNNNIINDFNDNKNLNSNYSKNNNKSLYSKNNTTASSSLNNYYLTINQNIKENSIFKLNPNSHLTSKDEIDKNNNYSKSTNNINYQTINKNLSIYEKKKLREKSNEYKIHSFIDKFENINNARHTDYMNTDNFKNKNILQDSINKVEINKNIYRNYISNSNSNSNDNYNSCRLKIIKRRKKNLFQNKTHNLVNKSLLYDYKGYDLNDKEYSPELLSNSSKTIEGTKYLSTILRSNSLESRKYKYRQILNIGKLDIYNNINNNNNKSNSNSLDNKHKTLTIEKNKSSYGMFNGKLSLNDKNYKTINYNILSTYNKNNFNKNIFNRNSEKTLQYENKSFNNSYGNYLKHKINNSVLNANNHNNSSYAKNNNNMYNTINSERKNEKLIYNNIYNNKKE